MEYDIMNRLISLTILTFIFFDNQLLITVAQQFEYKQVERSSYRGKYDRFAIDSDAKCSAFNARRINETWLGASVDKACECPDSASTLFFQKDGDLCLERSSKLFWC